MDLHILMHEYFEAPGAIELWAAQNMHDVTYTKLYEHDAIPRACDFDMLIIMGGPQAPTTTLEECPHFDAAREMAFIRQAVDAQKIVLGVCLGAQMIGEALGGTCVHSPNREIGVFPVRLTDDGKKDPLFEKFPETFDVGHWHGDMPGLTPEAKILATSDGCPRQIIRYTPTVYGFQCHFELTAEVIELLIENSTEALEQYKDLPYIETPEQLRAHDYSEMNMMLFQFLDRLTERV